MDLSKLQSKTIRKSQKRVGRGGKRGTTSGGGTKGQKSRTGASVKPGFRGGDNRLWQLFPKQKGVSKKPGGKGPHKKHRYFRLKHDKPAVFNLGFFNQFTDIDVITPEILEQKGLLPNNKSVIKVLGDGELKRKLTFEGFVFSKTAKQKITKLGGIIK